MSPLVDKKPCVVNPPTIKAWHKRAQSWIEVICVFLNSDGEVQSVQDAENRIVPVKDFDLWVAHE